MGIFIFYYIKGLLWLSSDPGAYFFNGLLLSYPFTVGWPIFIPVTSGMPLTDYINDLSFFSLKGLLLTFAFVPPCLASARGEHLW